MLRGLWYLSFLTRYQTHTLGSESLESSILYCRGISRASCSARRQLGLCLPSTCARPHTAGSPQSQGSVCVRAPCRASSCFLWLSVCVSWARPTCEPTQRALPPCRAGCRWRTVPLGNITLLLPGDCPGLRQINVMFGVKGRVFSCFLMVSLLVSVRTVSLHVMLWPQQRIKGSPCWPAV